jgi:hypothetical protein
MRADHKNIHCFVCSDQSAEEHTTIDGRQADRATEEALEGSEGWT